MKRLVLLIGLCSSFFMMAEEKKNAVVSVSNGSPVEAPVIGPEDTLSILVLGADELSKEWRVSSSGELSLPQVGTFSVAGMTAEQLRQELQIRLQRFYIDPQISVHITDFRSQPVIVTGAVEKPGIIQLEGTRTLFEAIVLAGGLKDPGATVRVVRSLSRGKIVYPGARIENDESVVVLPVKEVMEGSGDAADLPIQAHDVIAVSTVKQPRLVQITGDVNRPGAIELTSHDSISLVQAIAVAGGLTRTSKHDIQLVHTDANGNRTSSAQIDLKKVIAGRADDYRLHDGDIVIVPSSQISAFIQAAGLSAVTTGVYVLARF